MRFALFFCALLALFGGVRAEITELASAEITFSGASEHPDTIKTSESGDTEVAVYHEDSHESGSSAHTNDKKMNTEALIAADTTFPWTRISVGNAFNEFTFYQLRIQIKVGTNYVDAGTVSSTDPRGEYYASYSGPSTVPAASSISTATTNADINTDLAAGKLVKINKDTANGGTGDYYVRGYSEAPVYDDNTVVKSGFQGTAGGGWWPRRTGVTGHLVDGRFTYLWVKIVFPATNSGPFQGTVKIGLYANGGNACTTGACGDPQFIGLQGQNFQFHGMADEVFSLVSSPELQMNSLFKFISSGKCDYNDTMCWTHPGTYLGSIGIQYGADKILLQSGSHEEGMKVFINDKQVTPSKHIHQFTMTGNNTALAQYRNANKFTFNSDRFFIQLHNSDYFFNLDFGLKDQEILSVGSTPMRITGEICERENRLHKALLADTQTQIKAKLSKTYPAYPLHGLVGQTWRNAEYCGRYFEGTVDDYVVASLFGTDHTFNNFAQ